MRIGLLGTLAVYDEAGRLVRVGGSRVRVLLILLALDAGRVVPTYSLIERLWDDDPPANAGNALQSLVSRLRTSLRQAGLGGHLIESHPAGYRLAVRPDEVDAVAFEHLALEGSRALASGGPVTAGRILREALGIWRGPALADAAGAQFAAGPTARLEELRTRAALDLIEAGLALGESDSLIGELRQMIAANPLAERPRGLLMRALYAAGRQAEALAVYAETRELLASELGVDPSPRLEEIHLGVLRQDLPDAPQGGPQTDGETPAGAGDLYPDTERPPRGDPQTVRPAGVRTPLTSFVGRDEDVARVVKMLADSRLVTLTGPGGAGKTRLAIETAARLADGQQVWLADLTPVTDADEVPYAVLRAVGIRESPVIAHAGAVQLDALAEPVQRLVAALADRRDLLILDNCEHVVAAAAALADQVLAGCPGVRVLVTSREPLRITGETLWPVAPLPVPPAPQAAPDRDAPGAIVPAVGAGPGDPPPVSPAASTGDAGSRIAGYASVRLLADRAAAVRPNFLVDSGNAADVARICRALDGMPLAIELAAARLRTLSAAQLAERLDARFELLTGGSRTAVPRHQTLRAVVDWSWELLSGPEQVLARRLATFPGGATLTAAEHVCQDPVLPAETILSAISGLVEKSFLTMDEDGEPRYRMLETIRAYCAERLAEAGEEQWVRHAFATYFAALAETADPLLRGAGQRTWIRRLTAEQDNINAALHWAVEHREVMLALRFGQALGWFWLLRGQRRESAAMASDILAVSEPTGRADRDPLGGAAGSELAERGAAGSELAERGAAGSGQAVVHARAVCALIAVNATWDIAAFAEPLADVTAMMAPPGPRAGGDRGDRPPHPLALAGAVFLAFYERRDPDLALRLLAAHFESADPWTRSGARLMHAIFLLSMGRLDGLARECAEALAGFQALGDRWGMALSLVGRAELATLDGDYARAIAALEQAVKLTRELTDWEDTAQMYASLAKNRSRLGDDDGALADMSRAEWAARQQGESDCDLWISYIRAELAWLRGDIAEAGRISRRLDARMASRGSPLLWSFRAQAQNRSALADIRSGDAAGGCAVLAGALRLARDSQDRAAVAIVVDGLAAATLWTDGSRGNAERAAALLGAAHSIRGAFDHSSLDAPAARGSARDTLGAETFEAAYQRGRDLSYEDALAFAEGST